MICQSLSYTPSDISIMVASCRPDSFHMICQSLSYVCLRSASHMIIIDLFISIWPGQAISISLSILDKVSWRHIDLRHIVWSDRFIIRLCVYSCLYSSVMHSQLYWTPLKPHLYILTVGKDSLDSVTNLYSSTTFRCTSLSIPDLCLYLLGFSSCSVLLCLFITTLPFCS